LSLEDSAEISSPVINEEENIGIAPKNEVKE